MNPNPLYSLPARSPSSILALVFGLLLASVSTFYVYWSQVREREMRFEMEATVIQNRILSRFETYERALLQTAAFFKLTPRLTREGFAEYVRRADLLERYPGVQGFGYTARIPADHLQRHIQEIQASGLADYQVWPLDPPRQEYFSIVYLEPLDWRNKKALGFDMFTEPTRQDAMMRARDTGEPALTGKVVLVQETEQDTQPGFLLYVPVYKSGAPTQTVEDRRAALEGFIYAPFRSHDLFHAIFHNQPQAVDFEIFAGQTIDRNFIVYDHNEKTTFIEPNSTIGQFQTREFKVGGYTYIIAFHPLVKISSFAPPFIAGALGFIAALLLWWLVASEVGARRALQLLRRSEERLSLAIKNAGVGFYDWDITKDQVIFSDQMRKDWGLPPTPHGFKLEEALALIHPDDRVGVKEKIQQTIATGKSYDIEYRVQRPDGQIIWVDVHGAVALADNGTPIRFFGTSVEITRRKSDELALRNTHLKVERERAQYRAIFDKSPTAIAVLRGSDLTFEMANPAYTDLVAGREVVGKTADEALPEMKGQPFIGWLREVFETGKPIALRDAPVRLMDKSGVISERYVDFVYQQIEEDGKPFGVFVQAIDTTDKVLARKSIQESEERLRAYMESMPQMAFIAQANGDISYYNRRHYEYFGVKDGEHEGWGWKDTRPAVHPDDIDRTVKTWSLALNTGRMYEIEYRLRRHDGAFRWHLGRALAIRNSQGQVVQWFGTNTDIHDQKELLEQLKASENQLKFALDAGQMGTWIVHLKTNAVTLSEESYRLFGYTERTVDVAKIINAVIHPDDRDQAMKDLQLAIEQQSTYYSEYRIIRPADNEMRWILATGRSRRDEHGEPDIFSGVIMDITKRKKAEAELAEKTAFLETVVEQMPIASFFAEAPSGKLLFTNKAFHQVWRNPPSDTKSVAEYAEYKGFHSDGTPYKPEDWPVARAITKGEIVTNEEIEVELFDGTPAIMRLSAAPIRNQKGEIIAGVVLSEDVTDRIMLQRQLERTIQARDEFLSIASHELKTPLTTLKLQSQIFRRKSLKNDPKIYQREQVDAMAEQTDKQVNRLNRLVDDMLDIARIRSGKLTIEPEKFDLCELMTEITMRMKGQFIANTSQVPALDLPESAVGCWDRLRIEQVITNLFTNAIRYGAGKPVKVRVLDHENSVMFTVEDQGIGIAMEDKDKIFERFERAISASEVSGLGLGLYISKQIVEAHGGTIRVESQLGKGSTFMVELPKNSSQLACN